VEDKPKVIVIGRNQAIEPLLECLRICDVELVQGKEMTATEVNEGMEHGLALMEDARERFLGGLIDNILSDAMNIIEPEQIRLKK